MKKISFKLTVLALLAIFTTMNLSAQEAVRKAKVELSQEEKQDRRMEKLNKMADKLEMNSDQKTQFIAAQVDFDSAAKSIKDTDIDKKEKKAQLKTLATEHKTHLSSFLSEDQVKKIEKRVMKKKGKRNGKKGKKAKRDQPE